MHEAVDGTCILMLERLFFQKLTVHTGSELKLVSNSLCFAVWLFSLVVQTGILLQNFHFLKEFGKYQPSCVQFCMQCSQLSVQKPFKQQIYNVSFFENCTSLGILALSRKQKEIRFYLKKVLRHKYMTQEYANFGYQYLNQLLTPVGSIFFGQQVHFFYIKYMTV